MPVTLYLPGGAKVHPHVSLKPQGAHIRISIGSAVFAQLIAEGTYILQWLQWAAPSPSKLLLHIWGSGHHSYTWFLGHTRVHTTDGISISSTIFAGFTITTD